MTFVGATIVGMKGIEVTGSLSSIFKNALYGEGIKVGGDLASAYGGLVSGGSFPPRWRNDGADNPFDFARFPAGITVNGGSIQVFNQARLELCFMGMGGNDTFIDLQSQVDFAMLITDGLVNVSEQSNFDIFVNAADAPLLAELDRGIVVEGSKITAFEGVHSARGGGENGVSLTKGSTAELGYCTGSSEGTGYGIYVDYVSSCTIDTAPYGFTFGNTAVTGTQGNSLFGHTTVAVVKTYAQLRTPDGSGVEGFTDDYLNRIAPQQ
jgi:hypothetical protein